MKAKKEITTKFDVSYKPKGIYNPELDKFVGVDIFPEQTARARELLTKYPIPENVLKRNK